MQSQSGARRWRWLVIVAAVAILAVLGLVDNAIREAARTSRPDVYRGTVLDGHPAPHFRLTDQHGQSVALSDLRGKVVVLTFMDSRCTTVCPLTAAELRQTYKTLGAEASQIVFLGVNANPNAYRREDVADFTRQQRLDEIATWHFLTGSPQELQAVWKDYSIAVEVTHDGAVEHTPGVFVIDQQGRSRAYVSVPQEMAPQVRLSGVLAQQIARLLGE